MVGVLRRVRRPVGHATVWGPTRQSGYTWLCPGTALHVVTCLHTAPAADFAVEAMRYRRLARRANRTLCYVSMNVTSTNVVATLRPESLCWNASSGMQEMPPLNYIRLSNFSCKMHFGMDEKSVLSPLKLM